STGETSYPVLRKVLVAFGDQVGFADTLADALDQVFEGESGAETPDEQQTEELPEGEDQAVPPMAGTPAEQLSQALNDAREAIERSESAMADGDWAAYGRAQADLQNAIDRALALEEGDGATSEDDGDVDNTDAESAGD